MINANDLYHPNASLHRYDCPYPQSAEYIIQYLSSNDLQVYEVQRRGTLRNYFPKRRCVASTAESGQRLS